MVISKPNREEGRLGWRWKRAQKKRAHLYGIRLNQGEEGEEKRCERKRRISGGSQTSSSQQEGGHELGLFSAGEELGGGPKAQKGRSLISMGGH